MTDKIDREIMQQALDALIENARLLGYTEARQFYVGHSQQDAIFERALHECIAKHSAVLRERLAQPDPLQRFTDVQQEIEAALAPEQEPVACIVKGCSNHRGEGRFIGALCSPCHTFITTGEGKYSQAYRNSKREWQGLFFDAVYEAWHSAGMDVLGGDWNTFASTLKAKLKEKND
jgi:hypothetical protein